MNSEQDIEEFISKILSNYYLSYMNQITDTLGLYIRRLKLQSDNPIGEINAFLNALSMVGVIIDPIYINIKNNQLLLYAADQIYLKIPISL